MEKNENNAFYSFILLILRFLGKIFFRIEVIGKENMPIDGRVIIVANHKSSLDPLFMMIAVKERRIIPVAKKELFKVPVLSLIMKKLRVISIDRSNPSIGTIKTIISEIKKDKVLGIFPEGTRNKGEGFLPAKPGVALFAIKTRAIIIPMSIISTYRIFSKVKIVIGNPVDMEEYYSRKVNKEEYVEVAQKMMYVVEENYNKHKSV